MSPARRRLVGGLDLGGTKIQAVVMDGRREVIGEAKSATPTTDGAQDVILALVSTMGTACADAGVEVSDLTGVGVGSPGAIDTRRGVVTGARNLPGEGAPIRVAAGFKTLADTRAYVDNDVTVGVNAEYALGAGRRSKSLLGVWWGTGVGGGLVLNGEPWEGRGAAGELGHVVVKLERSRVHLRPARLHGGLRRPRRDGAARPPRAQARAARPTSSRSWRSAGEPGSRPASGRAPWSTTTSWPTS